MQSLEHYTELYHLAQGDVDVKQFHIASGVVFELQRLIRHASHLANAFADNENADMFKDMEADKKQLVTILKFYEN